MSEATSNRWSDEVKDSYEVLKTMRDELKVQMHLASMNARQQFDALETRLDNEQLNARKNLNELIASFRQLKDELGSQSHKS